MLENNSTSIRPIQVEIITMLLFHPNSLGALPLTGPGYDTAIEDIREKYNQTLNITNNLVTDPRYFSCDEWATDTDRAIGEFYFEQENRWNKADLVVFAGSHAGCNAKSVVFFATEMKKLVLTSVYAFATSSDKERWPTWISVSFDSRDIIVQSHLALMMEYNWTTISVVCDTSSVSTYTYTGTEVYNQLSRQPGFITYFHKINIAPESANLSVLLHKVQSQSRVVIFSGHSTNLRTFMLAARRLNMTSGDYVFANYWVPRSVLGNNTWEFYDKFDQDARAAYRVLLTIGTDNGQFQNPESLGYPLGQRWRRLSRDRYNHTLPKDDAMPRAANAYTSFMILGEILDQLAMTEHTEVLRNGLALTKLFLNRTFKTMIGNMYINPGGELVVPWYICTFDQDGKLRILLERNPITTKFGLVESVGWPSGVWPVHNRPPCGYDGKDPLCNIRGDSTFTAVVCIGSFILSLLIGLVFQARRLRIRAIEKLLWWRLTSDDLHHRKDHFVYPLSLI